MKKIFQILILITLFSAIFTSTTSAVYVDEDMDTWYTVDELLEYREQIRQEENELCGENRECRLNFFSEKYNEDRFIALNQLLQHQFVATMINPGQEIIEVIFFDEDSMHSWTGFRELIELNQVYVGWLEDDVERIYRDGMEPGKYRRGEISGAHQIYAWQNDDEEINLIGPNTITRLSAPGLNTNNTGQLIYNADAGPGKYAAYGRFIYSKCLSEPDYMLGDSCHLVFSAEKGYKYTLLKETDEKNEIMSNNIVDSDTSSEEVIKLSESSNMEVKEETVMAKAPNTGVETSLCNQKTIEFPWWLVIIIALGDMVVLKLFWSATKKPKKSLVNPLGHSKTFHQKSLDKKRLVR